MKAPVRLGIVGLGLIGRRHVEAAARVPEVEIVAAADAAEAGRNFAAGRGISTFGSLDALLASSAAEGVIVATPNSAHAEQGIACVARGLPTLIEKPIAAHAEEARVLVAAAEEAGVPLLVGHHRRHNPLIAAAKAAIDRGALGEIRMVQARCWLFKPDGYFEEAPWRKAQGAGPVLVNLIHDVDLMRHLCGEIVRVQAEASPARRGYANEDAAAATIRFSSGALGVISVSDAAVSPWSWELTARENPAYAQTGESCYEIAGSKGALSLPDLRLWRHEPEPDWFSPIASASWPRAAVDPLEAQLGHFAAVIRREATPLVSGREALKTLEVVEAIQEAARTGCAVRLG